MRASDLIIQIFTFVSVTAICLLAMRSFTALATVRRRLAGEKPRLNFSPPVPCSRSKRSEIGF